MLQAFDTPPTDFDVQMSFAICYIKHGDQYLFTQRNEEKKHWCIPGGKMEFGETPLMGCIREIKEETNIDLLEDQIKYLGKVYLRYPHGDFESYPYIYEVKSKPPITLNFENIDYKWLNLEEAFSKYPLFLGTQPAIELFLNKGIIS